MILINTCGTSLKPNLEKENIYSVKNAIELGNYLAEKINNINNLSDKIFGAEINSIYSILKKNKNKDIDILYFLVSDTKDGEKIGNILKTFFNAGKVKNIIKEDLNINIENIKVEKIEKLIGNEENYKEFNKGLSNLVKIIAEIKRDNSQKELIINATGGYKAQISFAGLIGQVLKIKVYYMFEAFPEVLELLPMPVNFDYKIISDYYDILLDIDKNWEKYPEQKSDELKNKLDDNIFKLLDLVEIDNTRYFNLSSVLSLALEGYKIKSQININKIEESRKNYKPQFKFEDQNNKRVPGLEKFFKDLAATGYFNILISKRYYDKPLTTAHKFEKGKEHNEITIYYKSKKDFTAICIGFTIAINEEERDSILYYLKNNYT
ncbi:MAG: putative CRISPR-associated protein [Candidatus Goldbacteria bacterium]|nr:putative CRISPR-associated protein [Candidatus Goldiibacteriota bacterium]